MHLIEEQHEHQRKKFEVLKLELEQLQATPLLSDLENAVRRVSVTNKIYDLGCVHERLCELEDALEDGISNGDEPAMDLLDSDLLRIAGETRAVLQACGPKAEVEMDVDVRWSFGTRGGPKVHITLLPKLRS
jgi:hypothetical protein